MIFTARQLEDLHKTSGGNGQIVLPYRARLTPLAQDFLRLRKIQVGYSDSGFQAKAEKPHGDSSCCEPGHANCDKCHEAEAAKAGVTAAPGPVGNTLWWTDSASGAAKAAITSQAKESVLTPLPVANDAKQLIPAIKALAAEIKSGKTAAGVLLVQHAAVAGLYANRCPSIRAVVGTCLETVDQGVQQVAANVLIVEHPRLTFPQIKNLLARFMRSRRTLSPDVERQLKELGSCG